ncbi:zinc-ribbon domain-containing protein [Geothrix sp. PMB-07]|uniref:zinc-ribbon domain-containing protein n=1 Tax=Geothrix sp. PMB-07 TaxID=3068640 RepID=UPI002741F32A|nr:zinc-ribbon domain-containing protein [Geothrix sp. PMB-07]WLT31074.1 zinc-ribbon domain-containing protein [Geothrix sp. PMB-07]
MAEAIHCPSCTTRYRLSPERLKPVIRRAKCFQCGGVFPVGDVVQRLLAPASQSVPQPAPLHSGTAGFTLDDVAAAHAYVPEPSPQPQLQPDPDKVPTLELSDLDVADAEILEKTLVESPGTLPETKAGVAGGPIPFPPEITETTLSGYTSARDAIEKLFGNVPAAASALKVNREPGTMDMEATMSALDTTLGAPTPPSARGAESPGDGPTASGLTEEDLAGPSSSTMRLSQEDLQAIVDAAPPATAKPAEPTVALRASDLLAAKGSPAGTQAPTFAPLNESQETGAELLRLKIGEDIYGGLTMPQIIAWVEEGRILENHLVARQQSENWLEAHKVPGLRPVFERLRRERSGGAPSLNPGIGEIAPKKSLFGGLFGKN